MSEQLFIDAGPSSRGWSYWGDFFACPRLFAYKKRLGVQLGSSDGRTRGSMIHTGLAHLFARWGAVQKGGVLVGTAEGVLRATKPDCLLPAEGAIERWIVEHGTGEQWRDVAITVVRKYAARTAPPAHIVGVELEMHGVLGWRRGRWGLHISNGLVGALDADVGDVEPTPLDRPGAPDHGQPITITRRADLIRAGSDGQIEVVDHKAHAHVSAARARDEYMMEGGWAPFRIMARQLWGARYSGRIMLNLLQTTKPWTLKEEPLPPTPYADAAFAEDLLRAAHLKAEYEAELDSWKWPMRRTACMGVYGLCDAAQLCAYGPSAIRDVESEE